MDARALEAAYAARHATVLLPMAQRLQSHLSELFAEVKRIDRISVRAKDISRFAKKAGKVEHGAPKYSDPMNQIQDQIGARIVVFYRSDVLRVCDVIEQHFRSIEARLVVPDSESEFGYFGKHYMLFIPSGLYDESIPVDTDPTFFELQVKTLFQHAWAEAGHDLAYKPDAELTPDQRRKVAFTSAQAWGADEMFEQLQHDLGLRAQ